jgi:hypothetical protein
MSTLWPGDYDNFYLPQPTDSQDGQIGGAGADHATQHGDANAAIMAIERYLGITGAPGVLSAATTGGLELLVLENNSGNQVLPLAGPSLYLCPPPSKSGLTGPINFVPPADWQADGFCPLTSLGAGDGITLNVSNILAAPSVLGDSVDLFITMVVWDLTGANLMAVSYNVSAITQSTVFTNPVAITQTQLIGSDLSIVSNVITSAAGGSYNVVMGASLEWD